MSETVLEVKPVVTEIVIGGGTETVLEIGGVDSGGLSGSQTVIEVTTSSIELLTVGVQGPAGAPSSVPGPPGPQGQPGITVLDDSVIIDGGNF